MRFFTLRLYLIFAITPFCLFASGLTAKFTYTKRSNCAPTIVEFVSTSSQGAGITYTWDFGLGAEVTTTNPSKKEQVYIQPGKYTVTLKVSDGVNTETFSAEVIIAQGPAASFKPDATAGCNPLTVSFSSTSVPGDSAITSTSWDFRNGDSKTGQTVQYTYNKAGKFGIYLKVTDKNGCSGFISSDSIIRVVNKPVVNFTASDTAACSPPLNVSFLNLSGGASELTYLWNYGNGKTSTDVSNSSTYDAKGSFSVKLTATDQFGCSSTLEKKNYINVGNPTGSISIYDYKMNPVTNTRLCSGAYTFVFSAGNMPVCTWTITDNNKTTTISGKSSITYTIKDTGSVKLNFIYGNDPSCTDVIQKTFTKNNVKANFATDIDRYCALPQKINLTSSAENAVSYSWFIDKKLFASTANSSYTITASDIPPQTYEQLYQHEIDSVSLPIKLLVTNSDGCTDSVIRSTYLSIPVSRFMPDKTSGCVPLQVTFADSSRSAYKLDTYIYKVDGQTITSATNADVNYTFTKTGIYEVTKIVKSGTCSDTSHIVKIAVGEKLKPDLTVSPAEVCNDGKIRIAANADKPAAISSWNLKSPGIFDITSTKKPDTLITVYSDTTGLKSLTLQVNYNGCFSDTTKKDIFKITGPAGNFTSRFSCDTSLVYWFRSKMSPATSLTWELDNTSFTDKDSIRYKFSQRGDYAVKLTAKDNISGCTLVRTKTIQVRQIKAKFALKDTIFCAGDSVKLDATQSADYINSCYNEGFLWKFGDDSPPRRVSTPKYSHIYSAKGKFKLKLIAMADNGCIDSAKQYVYIKKPEAKLTVDKYKGCVPGLTVNFENTSTDSTIVRSFWDFDDGLTSTSQSKKISHTYNSNKQQTFLPTLFVFDAYQCYGEYTLPITLVSVSSDFQLSDNAICAGQTITFDPVEAHLDSVIWVFGDGATSKKENNHVYNNKGVFTPSLTAYKNGCSGIISKANFISVEKADGAIWLSDSVLKCYPDTVMFIHRNTNGSPAVERTWIFNTDALNSENDTIKYIYTRPGNYNTQLSVRTLNGCQAVSSKNISITGPEATFDFTPKTICYGENVTFKVEDLKNVTQWKWIFGDGNTSTTNPASHGYTSKGNIVPAINLINQDCNTILALDTLHIDRVTAKFVQKDSAAICLGGKATFKNTSAFSEYWTWQINDVFKNNELDFTDVVFTKKGQNTITLIASSDNCSDTLTRTYTVYDNPAFKIQGDSVLCAGEKSINLSVAPSNGWSIKWSPTTGIDNSASFSVLASPASNTTYNATVTDARGCKTTIGKTILINKLAQYARIPLADTTISIGDKIMLQILSDTTGINYTWSPNYNIACTNCSSAQVRPAKDVTYTVQIKNNCVDFSEKFNIKVIFDFYLEAPSAFTPNGDSNNDVFRFEERNINAFELKIFNRWGQLVFKTNDINEGWDGTVNGKVQNADTYTYFVKAETNTGYKFEKNGNFLLLK